MDPMKSTDLVQKNAEKYKSMDPNKKTDLLQKIGTQCVHVSTGGVLEGAKVERTNQIESTQ